MYEYSLRLMEIINDGTNEWLIGCGSSANGASSSLGYFLINTNNIY